MTLTTDGRFAEDSTEEILDAMMADAKEYFGNDLNDDDEAIIRLFYQPIAERLAAAQGDIGLVLDSAQLDFAEGAALDLLTALIGIRREQATNATGTVTFSRGTAASTDYTVPKGTAVQTDSSTPVRFETTETVVLASGTTSVDAAIEAVQGGVDGNVGANTIVVIPGSITGVESVTNAAATDGGADREPDDELRVRAQQELSAGSRASAPALVSAVSKLDGVTSVHIDINDTNSTDADGRPGHSWEMTVSGGNNNTIAQTLLDTKAGGDTSVGGYAGTATTAPADLPNGQTHDITFSRPTAVKIYVDMTLSTTDTFAGNDAVRDSIVQYLGGILSTGNEATGLGTGEDVVYGEIEYAIRDVEGVYDVTSLTIGKTASPTGTSNIAIAAAEEPTADATDGSITIS